MSTRSVIIVTDTKSTTRLYKHSDGYPSHTLYVIYHALADAQKVVESDSYSSQNIIISSDVLVGKLIGHGTSAYGRGIRVEKEFDGPFKLSHIGDQSDLDYIYVVNTYKKTITIYDGDIQRGPISEESMSRDADVKKVKSLMGKINALGFKFVHKEDDKKITEASFTGDFFKRVQTRFSVTKS